MTIERIRQMKRDVTERGLLAQVSIFEFQEAFDLAISKLLDRERQRKKMAKRRKAMKKGVR